jgi:lipoate-protein ligase A
MSDTTPWRSYPWELLRPEALQPNQHMALDEILFDAVGSGKRPPTLRIWEWAASAVVIGRFQSVRNEIDPDGAKQHNIQVVRRITGGGAMFIEPGNTITYSLYAPANLVFGMSTVESYAFLDNWVIEALRSFGVEAWYQPINDITSAAGKIGGAAQKRKPGVVLHHVTMAYDIDTNKMLDVLRIGREKLSDKGTASAAKRVDPVRRQTGATRTEVIDRMVETFERLNGLTRSELTIEEREATDRLVETKFGTDDWLYALA